jgi:hypothetical protein
MGRLCASREVTRAGLGVNLKAPQQDFRHVPLQRGPYVSIQIRRLRSGPECAVGERLQTSFERELTLEDEARTLDTARFWCREADRCAIDERACVPLAGASIALAESQAR